MPKSKENWQILSVGGSIIVPDKIDFEFLKKFHKFIQSWLRRGKKFIIFVGGGKLTREYQSLAKRLKVFKVEDLDQIGIQATYLNAYLVKSLFGNLAYSEIIKNPTLKVKTEKRLVFGGGYKPGWSTDYDAVLMAKTLSQKLVINASDIDFLYDRDPDKYKTAKPLRKTNFQQFFKIIDKKWKPGANLPFDPLAARLAQKEKIKVIILNGRNLDNLEKFLKGKNFKGTIIES